MLQRLAGTQADLIRAHVEKLKQTAKGVYTHNEKPSTVNQTLRNAIAPLKDDAIGALGDIAEYESEFTSKLLTKFVDGEVSSVERSSLLKTLEEQNMEINNIDRSLGSRKSIDMAYKQFGNRKADELAQIVKDGMYQELEQSEVFYNIDRYIATTIARQIEALAVTSINYASSIGRNETMIQAEQIEYVEWVLDDNVIEHTDYCLEHEGNVYVVGDGPVPPAHWGCQSDLVPWFGDPNDASIVTGDSEED
jgi:hypothetical protein